MNKPMNETPRFRGKYFFLSNFYEVPIDYNGIIYGSSEAAYQAQKNPKYMKAFQVLSPREAKRLGNEIPIRKNWNKMKIHIMYDIVLAKFTQHPELAHKLIATGNLRLVENNSHGDIFWGICDGIGENYLGRILMRIRYILQDEDIGSAEYSI